MTRNVRSAADQTRISHGSRGAHETRTRVTEPFNRLKGFSPDLGPHTRPGRDSGRRGLSRTRDQAWTRTRDQDCSRIRPGAERQDQDRPRKTCRIKSCSSPETLSVCPQRHCVSVLRDTVCLPYLDKNLVLQHHKDHRVKLTPKKCELFRHSEKFLGQLETGEGHTTDPAEMEPVRHLHLWQKNVDAWFPLVLFILNCSRDAQPLCSRLTAQPEKFTKVKKNKSHSAFQWTSSRRLTKPPVNKNLDFTQLLMLHCDASQVCLSRVLNQRQEKTSENVWPPHLESGREEVPAALWQDQVPGHEVGHEANAAIVQANASIVQANASIVQVNAEAIVQANAAIVQANAVTVQANAPPSSRPTPPRPANARPSSRPTPRPSSRPTPRPSSRPTPSHRPGQRRGHRPDQRRGHRPGQRRGIVQTNAEAIVQANAAAVQANAEAIVQANAEAIVQANAEAIVQANAEAIVQANAEAIVQTNAAIVQVNSATVQANAAIVQANAEATVQPTPRPSSRPTPRPSSRPTPRPPSRPTPPSSRPTPPSSRPTPRLTDCWRRTLRSTRTESVKQP
ncbi:hypothetical protein WMY93_033284 [Mugilogobius chulae]|uniref:Uncharacterized protein n=1 Tax=Mugilogobius chulae TaxID=88201 RepID=A0AAW0MJ20_9GOBI